MNLPTEVIDAAKAVILEEPPFGPKTKRLFDTLYALCTKHEVSVMTATTAAFKQLREEGVLVRGPIS